MATRKTLDEQILKAQEEVRQKQNHIKELLKKQKKAERNARTNRLIQRGAILESQIGDWASLTNEQIKLLLEKTIGTDYGRKIMNGVKAHTEPPTPKTAVPVTNKPAETRGFLDLPYDPPVKSAASQTRQGGDTEDSTDEDTDETEGG